MESIILYYNYNNDCDYKYDYNDNDKYYLNYFEKNILDHNHSYIGKFNIKNDYLNIKWNNNIIEDFLFQYKNKNEINIYKNIDIYKKIKIFYKHQYLCFFINNHSQIFNILKTIYGHIQYLHKDKLKIKWIFSKKELKETYILNNKRDTYYLMENNIENNKSIYFHKIYYFNNKKIYSKKIIIDDIYKIIYDKQKNIIGSFIKKDKDNTLNVLWNISNDYYFVKINNHYYSTIIIKNIYKLININNTIFYFYKNKLQEHLLSKSLTNESLSSLQIINIH
jgi:hypothetical protein